MGVAGGRSRPPRRPVAPRYTAGPMQRRILKHDAFGEIALVEREGTRLIRRDLTRARLWLRPVARYVAGREARALRALDGVDGVPRLLGWDGRALDRSYIAGRAMQEGAPPALPYFRAARALLHALHARGVVHNDLAKEPNWLIRPDGSPAVVDFQLAIFGAPRGRFQRLLAREDLRHLLKHKRHYHPGAITPVERRLLSRPSWLRRAWFASGKRVYRWVTRRLLRWEDNEGRGVRTPRS